MPPIFDEKVRAFVTSERTIEQLIDEHKVVLHVVLVELSAVGLHCVDEPFAERTNIKN